MICSKLTFPQQCKIQIYTVNIQASICNLPEDSISVDEFSGKQNIFLANLWHARPFLQHLFESIAFYYYFVL